MEASLEQMEADAKSMAEETPEVEVSEQSEATEEETTEEKTEE